MTDPIKRYRALVQAGELECDPAQQRAAERLELLHNRLRRYQPGRRSLFDLFKGRSNKPPPGLYLFGDVGRGKSMLMDLFFDGAPLTHKRRVHFHSFMMERKARLS